MLQSTILVAADLGLNEEDSVISYAPTGELVVSIENSCASGYLHSPAMPVLKPSGT
jgi:hypothetical protein